MKEKVRRNPKKLLTINARNRVTLEVSAPNSNPKIREQRRGEKPSKQLGMIPPNLRRKRNNKKWPTFASWLLKTRIRYHIFLIYLVMIIVNMMMMIMMMRIPFASKLMHKYTSLLSKKKFYKYKFTSLTKEFEDLKIEFSNLVKSNDKLVNDLEISKSLEDQLKKANDENQKLSKEVLELKNSISKFNRGKETLGSLPDSQNFMEILIELDTKIG